MSVCKYCGQIGGYHFQLCPRPREESPGFQMVQPTPQPQPAPTHYVERCGGLTVYQPIRPKPRKTP